MKNVILFASQGNNVGKSSAAINLSELICNSVELYSFASPIRKHCNDLFKNKYNIKQPFTYYYSNRNLKNNNIYDTLQDSTKCLELKKFTFRSFINEASDKYQLIHGDTVWAEMAVKALEDSKSEVILIDDFRRRLEGDYVINNLDSSKFNVITVYLIKENVKNQIQTSFEGLLENYDFDIRFNINSDYSNMPDLYKTILSKLKG